MVEASRREGVIEDDEIEDDDYIFHTSSVERGISIAVILLILWLYLSTLYFVMIPWLIDGYRYPEVGDAGRKSAFIAFLFYNFLCLMTLWSMVMAGFTDPGGIPAGFAVKDAAEANDDRRVCRKCFKLKPDRCHHCRHCKRCILRMDHHCPWIGNCVGYRNHGHFLRFLTYATLSCAFGLLAIAVRLFRGYLWYPFPSTLSSYYFGPEYAPDELNQMQIIISVMNGIFVLCILLMLSILFFYQWYLCLQNMTTIEQLEYESCLSANIRRLSNPRPVVFPYKLGWRRNLDVILGHRRWAWPWPLLSDWQLEGQGNGIFFEKEEGVDPEWPPKMDLSGDDGDEEQHPKASRSDPLLPRRERFRRGSEGYMIPVGEIGVKFHESHSTTNL